ncbi:MAG: 16S rRNA (cytidine(1402)-2'-O)-methyltransferase [Anaerolineales bacterium]|jgi:16S rRNA (cytidine1402-2'-O)-methyltransferase
MGILYLVATPIGNLEDITLRALRVLAEVDLIAVEDTRHTRKLLRRYQIETPSISYHEHNKLVRKPKLLQALDQGEVALVSDAGTPGLSDPGYELVRAALEAGHQVSPIPGPSAPVAALVASGLPMDAFTFLGYLPRRASERRRFLRAQAANRATMVAFEVPHRIRQALSDLEAILGSRRHMAVCRELTKMHEQILRGTVQEMREYFDQERPRGEFTLVIAGAPAERAWDEGAVRKALAEHLRQGRSPSEAAREVAAEAGWPRKEVYRLTLQDG